MTQGYTRAARWEDVPALAADMRDADVAEVQAYAAVDPATAIGIGLRAGVTNVICLPDDTPVAVYGVTPAPAGYAPAGCVWMLATNEFRRLHRPFLRQCRDGLREIGAGHPALFNFTDARNEVHHRWLKWLGFSFIKRHEAFGAEQRPFLEFVRIMEA